MADLPDIEDLYPYTVKLKHKGEVFKVSLAAVKWLEAQDIMNIVDFHLEMRYEDEKLAILFKNKAHAKTFKTAKKEIRELALREA